MRVSISKRFDIQDDLDAEQVPEVELNKLQKQHRFMDKERRSYFEYTQNSIKKQNKAIENLLKERQDMLTNIKVTQSAVHEMKSNKSLAYLSQLLERYDYYRHSIENLKLKSEQADAEMAIIEKELKEKKKGPSCTSRIFEQKALQKKIRILENRVDHAAVNFNQMLSQNAKLREDIDHLLLQQRHFDAIRKKFTKKLADDKKQMTKLIDEATKAYDARDDAQAKIQNLKERNKREAEQFSYDVKELERVINHSEKLRHFMLTKAMSRLTMEREEAKRQKLRAEKRALESAPKESLDVFEEVYSLIKASTNMDNFDEIMSKYLQVEEDNFAIFNYISELGNDIELYQEEIKKIQVLIEEYKAKNKETEAEQWKKMKKIEDEIEEVCRNATIAGKQMIANKKTLEQIKENLKAMMRKLSWDTTTELPDELSEVTDSNILVFMGIIEQRINKILRMDQFFRFKKQYERGPDDMGLLGAPSTIQAAKTVTITIQPPSFTLDLGEEEAEIELKPLSVDELRDKVLRSFEQRMNPDNALEYGKSQVFTK